MQRNFYNIVILKPRILWYSTEISSALDLVKSETHESKLSLRRMKTSRKISNLKRLFFEDSGKEKMEVGQVWTKKWQSIFLG